MIQTFGNKPVHVINIDIQDNHEEATIGAFLICELVTLVGYRFECNIILNKLGLIRNKLNLMCKYIVLKIL